MNPTDTQPSFLARLKQHHLYRVALGYGTAIAIGIQVVARAFPYFGWTAAVPAVIIILIASFPVAIVLTWLLVKPADPAQQTAWQKRHWKLGAIVTPVVIAAVVVSGIYAFRFTERHEARVAAERIAQAKPAAPVFNPPADTLVVLPFTNLGGDPKQQYFSDGITEELTDALGHNPALTVIAWEAASKFRDSGEAPGAIGKALDVANILHGSIERENGMVRVIAELVNTRTGTQVWSAHYDDAFANIFKVQDHISQAVASALLIKFAGAQAVPTLNPAAHDWVLKGLTATDRSTDASLEEATQDFKQAIALDPYYADAYGLLARAYINLADVSTLSFKATLTKARVAAKKALMLDPKNVPALVVMGGVDFYSNQVARAKLEFEQALALDPSNSYAHMDYGFVLPLKLYQAQEQEAALLDPYNVYAQENVVDADMDLQNYTQALPATLVFVKLSPYDIDSAFDLAFVYQQLHRERDMVSAFNLVKPATTSDRQLVAAARLTYESLRKPQLHSQALAAVEKIPSVKLNSEEMYDLFQLYMALGEKKHVLQRLTRYCASAPDSCSDLAYEPVFLPLHGNPRFEELAKQYTTITLQ